jgi:ABC-2 type transport system permease protein
VISAAIVFLLSRVYFKVNSRVHAVKVSKGNKNYKIKTHGTMRALIGKEARKFATSPVFVTNAAFGLVLFVAGVATFAIKFEDILNPLVTAKGASLDSAYPFIPVALLGFIIVSSLMSSISSSMISLEGKSFNILKSLPVKPYTIIQAKILTAVMVCIPFLLIGDIIAFIRFDFNLLEIALVLIASVLLPLVTQTIGIIVNLRFPKMDAQNDAEVVKQSASATVAVFTGLILICASGYFILNGPESVDLTMAITVLVYAVIYAGLHFYLRKVGVKQFNEIQA